MICEVNGLAMLGGTFTYWNLTLYFLPTAVLDSLARNEQRSLRSKDTGNMLLPTKTSSPLATCNSPAASTFAKAVAVYSAKLTRSRPSSASNNKSGGRVTSKFAIPFDLYCSLLSCIFYSSAKLFFVLLLKIIYAVFLFMNCQIVVHGFLAVVALSWCIVLI